MRSGTPNNSTNLARQRRTNSHVSNETTLWKMRTPRRGLSGGVSTCASPTSRMYAAASTGVAFAAASVKITLRMQPPEYGTENLLVEERERFVLVRAQSGADLDDARDGGV